MPRQGSLNAWFSWLYFHRHSIMPCDLLSPCLRRHYCLNSYRCANLPKPSPVAHWWLPISIPKRPKFKSPSVCLVLALYWNVHWCILNASWLLGTTGGLDGETIRRVQHQTVPCVCVCVCVYIYIYISMKTNYVGMFMQKTLTENEEFLAV